ncbi:hypothetical protein [Pseudalkalibacillus berkeleyi]|uniref:Uncharacterized protein n=1 Tax=Pseudalkalibacillus berkeleyi TaxID=1069813 RepID=A0ABS9H597_9BACL|nr:hypothetical protein [Pseudalkalibacillus berkeleyi]MCF6138865.1 hypothetical protein [Pseudalkalibacillus berkeleyi]
MMIIGMLISSVLLFGIIYYGVRMGIDSSETSKYVKKIHDKLEKQDAKK